MVFERASTILPEQHLNKPHSSRCSTCLRAQHLGCTAFLVLLFSYGSRSWVADSLAEVLLSKR